MELLLPRTAHPVYHLRLILHLTAIRSHDSYIGLTLNSEGEVMEIFFIAYYREWSVIDYDAARDR